MSAPTSIMYRNSGRTEAATDSQAQNPVPELLDDVTYSSLVRHNLIDENALRNYLLRRRFSSMRSRGVAATDAIEELHRDHPYLQFDTIRKIVYRRHRK